VRVKSVARKGNEEEAVSGMQGGKKTTTIKRG
jgi:hypothetical protein